MAEDLVIVPPEKPKPKKDELQVNQLREIIQDFQRFRAAVDTYYDEAECPEDTDLEMDKIERVYCGFFKELLRKREKQPTMEAFFQRQPSGQQIQGKL